MDDMAATFNPEVHILLNTLKIPWRPQSTGFRLRADIQT